MLNPLRNFLMLLAVAGSLAAADQTVFITQKISFSNNTEVPEGSMWMWDFGDKTGVSNKKEPEYAYPKPNTYTVVLKVKVPNIAQPIPSNPIQIEVKPVEPMIEVTPNKFFMGEEVTFKTQYDDRSGLKFEWDFGDDTNGTKSIAMNRFRKSGKQNVTCYVKVPDGATLTFPVPNLTADPIQVAIQGSSETEFDGSAPISITNITTGPLKMMAWRWTITGPDGKPLKLEDTAARDPLVLMHLFESEGEHSVILKATLPDVPGVVIPESAPIKIIIASSFEKPLIKEISVAQSRIGGNGDYTAQIFVDASGDYERVEVSLAGLENPPAQKKEKATKNGRHIFKFTVPIPPESISRKPVSREISITATIHPDSPNAQPVELPKSISLTIIPQQPGWILYLYIGGGILVMAIIAWFAIRTARS